MEDAHVPERRILPQFPNKAFLTNVLKTKVAPNDQTSLKWLTVAMPLLENSKRQERERDKTRVRLERDKIETREIWSYGGWPNIV